MTPFNPFALNIPGPAVKTDRPIGFGTAGISDPDLSDAVADETMRTAWDAGIRYFDTAPMYGSGLAEVRAGRALAGTPRDEYILSSKVGRLVAGAADIRAAGTDWFYDFSRDGILRSVEASLARLGLDRIDLLMIHDADDFADQAITEAWPVLEDLRRQGVVQAVGAGMTTVPTLLRFARETSMDYFLVAGRYTLLATASLDDLMPLCEEKGIGVLVAQALHGGLIDGMKDPHLFYRPVDEATREKVARIAAICHAHGIPTAAAAIQFPLGHSAVRGILTGPMTGEQLRGNLAWMTTEIPGSVWDELKAAGLLRADAPIPDLR